MVPLILRLDRAGHPQGWMPWQDAAVLYAKDHVSWTAGDNVFRVHGGHNRITGERSYIDIHSIVAVSGQARHTYQSVAPLNNRELFRRDGHRCLYCGNQFMSYELTRDHIIPRSRNGRDTWVNVVTACRRCNHRKSDRLLEECRMELLAVPYTPNRAEYLALLNNGRILGDQMAFLETGFSRHWEQH